MNGLLFSFNENMILYDKLATEMALCPNERTKKGLETRRKNAAQLVKNGDLQ